MDAEPTSTDYGLKPGNGEKRLRQGLAEDVGKEFGPLVARFGFAPSGWDYDEEEGHVQVHFENPEDGDLVHLNARTSDGYVAPVYCRIDGEWEICRSGKPKKSAALKKILARWLDANCERCCIGCDRVTDEWGGDDYPSVPEPGR